MTYLEFLQKKIPLARFDGYEVDTNDLNEINPLLRPHQAACVKWAVKGGNRALFEAFGLGKSSQQIEIVRLTRRECGGKALIVCPLGVRQEFRRDGLLHGEQWEARAAELGFDIADIRRDFGVAFKFIRRSEEIEDGHDFYLTNYESIRDGRLDPSLFSVVSLDEASILRSYGSKTFQEFLPLFRAVKHKFVATATPSPNRYKELIHYAGFLGIMDTGQALTRFFQRDSTQANNLTLYPHKEAEFYLWLNSWAIFLQKPSDLGYPDDGYDLPELKVIYHEVKTNHELAGAEKDGQGMLFKDAAAGLQAASAEKRDSLPARIARMTEILQDDPDAHYLLWHDLEAERHAIKDALPEAVAVYGSQDLEKREQAICDFSDGKFQYLAAKPVIAGSGCNFQRHCHKAIFLGVGYKFNDFIQATHRIHRFLQKQQVEIHVIYSEAEREILKTLQEKWQQHERLVDNMTSIIKKHGLNHLSLSDVLARTIGCERMEVKGERFTVANNDCVLEAQRQPENHVDLIVTSIPFANHYEYTPSYNDFGHTDGNGHFWEQMDYLTPELLRILKPGRIYACHVKDRILFGNVTGAGAPTVSPFHCEAIMHGRQHGFDYLGMITIVTDVVRENNQTYRLGWSEQCKDGTKMGVGSPEYVVLFRKPQTDRSKGYADLPVKKEKKNYTRARWQVDAHAFWRSSGDRQLTAEELSTLGPDKLARAFTEYTLQNLYDYEFHIKIGEDLEKRGALPSSFMSLAPGSHHADVWTDVNRMITLNTAQSQKRAMLHVCPLQFDIVDRLITRYSNKGELVYDPFCGLGTVPYRALKLGRKGQGSELNPQYFLDSVQYLKAMEAEVSMPSLFDLIEEREAS
ncbi:MAG: DNA methyltransferase [Desulfuromonadales bacterium]|nr:DNA methyltransferase [Desulfuromonadales bacterium]